jgi:hypothetical protein
MFMGLDQVIGILGFGICLGFGILGFGILINFAGEIRPFT